MGKWNRIMEGGWSRWLGWREQRTQAWREMLKWMKGTYEELWMYKKKEWTGGGVEERGRKWKCGPKRE